MPGTLLGEGGTPRLDGLRNGLEMSGVVPLKGLVLQLQVQRQHYLLLLCQVYVLGHF